MPGPPTRQRCFLILIAAYNAPRRRSAEEGDDEQSEALHGCKNLQAIPEHASTIGID
jgi:hypothetical protein